MLDFRNGKEKIFRCIVFILISACLAFSFVSCSGNPSVEDPAESAYNTSDVFRDLSYIKYFATDINQSTTAVGLIENSSSSRSLDSYTNYLLVKVDEGESEPEPVTFKATEDLTLDGRSIKAGDVVSQDVLFGSVDKVYVIGDYTLISFLAVDALSLINREDTALKSYSNGLSYSGSINSFGEYLNNGEWSGFFNYNLFSYTTTNGPVSNPADYLEIYGSFQKTLTDSSGEKQYENIDFQESLVLRCEFNDVPAKNEYSEVSMYDTFGYYSSELRRSFIIDNNNGYIYEIPKIKDGNGLNLSVHMGVVIDRKLGPVKLSVNADGTLDIEQILENPSIYIYDAFKDIYGQYYIRTDSLSGAYDDVVFFTTSGEYIPMKNGEVLHLKYNSTNIGYEYGYQITDLSVMGEDYSETPVPSNYEADISYSLMFFWNNDYRFMESGLYNYNSNNGHDNWNDNVHPTSGSEAKFMSIADGKLVTAYTNGTSLTFCSYDISSKESTVISMLNSPAEVDFRFALLDNKYCIRRDKQEDHRYTISCFDPIICASSLDLYNVNGVHTNVKNDLIDDAVWNYAMENGLAMVYDPYSTGTYVSPLSAGYTDSKSKTYDGELSVLVIVKDHSFSEIKETYIEKYSTIKLLENVSTSSWDGYDDALTMSFSKVSRTGTDTYQITKDDNGCYVSVLKDSITLEARKLTLQPINK